MDFLNTPPANGRQEVIHFAVKTLLEQQILQGKRSSLSQHPQCLSNRVPFVLGVAHLVEDEITYNRVEFSIAKGQTGSAGFLKV